MMRIYEFSPETSTAPIFTIKISDSNDKSKVVTQWRDFGGNLKKLHDGDTSAETRSFFRKLTNFWRSVCKFEKKANPAMVEEIIDAVADPELQQFLNSNCWLNKKAWRDLHAKLFSFFLFSCIDHVY